jgi:hypothetical protein
MYGLHYKFLQNSVTGVTAIAIGIMSEVILAKFSVELSHWGYSHM